MIFENFEIARVKQEQFRILKMHLGNLSQHCLPKHGITSTNHNLYNYYKHKIKKVINNNKSIEN